MRSVRQGSRARAALAALALLCAALPAAGAQGAREVARAVLPSVLTLEVYGADATLVSRASAFFVAPSVVATSYHALAGGRTASAHTSDGAFDYLARGVVAADAGSDLALLELAGADGRPLALSAATSLELGAPVYVFGSPKGLDGSVTTGVVSGGALRKVAGLELLQISAPISPGNSGGPVVDERGEVVGVATLTVDEGRSLNFAVPAAALRRLLDGPRTEPAPISSLPPGGPALRLAERADAEPACCADGPLSLPSGKGAGFYAREGDRLYDALRFAEAKEAYRRAADLDPKDAWAQFALSHAYARLGCERRAVVAGRQAVVLAPKERAYRDGLGWTLISFGRYAEAAEVYEETLRRDPKQALPRARLGICYASLGRTDDAASSLREALRLDAKCALARFWLGKLSLERFGDVPAALEQYRLLETQDAELAEQMRELLSAHGR